MFTIYNKINNLKMNLYFIPKRYKIKRQMTKLNGFEIIRFDCRFSEVIISFLTSRSLIIILPLFYFPLSLKVTERRNSSNFFLKRRIKIFYERKYSFNSD